MQKERRYLRVRLLSKVIIRDGAATSEEGNVVDISLGGMGLRVQNKRPKGSQITVEFILPSNRKLRVKAEVVRIAEHPDEKYPVGIGISFIKLPPEGKAEIDSYVRRTSRILRALFFELNRANVDEGKIAKLVEESPIEHKYPLDILREIVASELSGLRLRPGNNFQNGKAD